MIVLSRFSTALSAGFCLLLGLGTSASAAAIQPETAALSRVRLFPEPLAPVGGEPSPAENVVLAAALQGLAPGAPLTPMDAFIQAHPQSPWLPSLLLNRGLRRFDQGYFSSALADWTQAWTIGKDARGSSPDGEALVVRALAEAVKMYCRVGRVAEAKALLAEFGDRPALGLNASMLDQSRKAIVQMETLPDDCFKCGPFALGSILKHQGALTAERHARLTAYATTAQGTSLGEVAKLARGPLGLDLQPVRRSAAKAALPLPAVVHWKLDHYGALLEFKDGRYLLVDPTFGTSQWIEAEALAQEASGYFLVPAGPLPTGFAAVGEQEAGKVWGRGNCREGDGNGTKKNDPKVPKCPPKGKGRGMADWSIHHALASLNLEDTPLSYQPPVGPEVAFRVNYSQLEQNQPTTLNFSNVGPLWNFNWVSSLTFDSNNAFARLGEGGTELFTRFNGGTQTYDPEQATGALLVRVSPTLYERRATDGSKLVFGLPDGSGRIFLTQEIDPQGNALTYGYDANFRLVSLTDASGQVTTLEHGSNTPGQPLFYRVTKVTDPFGRFTTLTYNASQQLTSVTDTIGIVSQFAYDANGKITTLTTPYGVTGFAFGFSDVAPAGAISFVEVTEPNGAKQRVESVQTSVIPSTEPAALIPADMPARNDYLQWRNSFYWDRRAMAEAPGDYTKAQITHFLHLNVTSIKASVIESEKAPLENRVWYFYQGQADSIFTNEGMRSNPTHIGRVLDDGSTQLQRYTYNDQGNVTQSIDPLGRTTKFGYAANGIDLLTIKQVNAQGGDDLIVTYTWNAQHRPVTVTDSAGATTTMTYNARGQVTSVTNAKGEATTLTYDALGRMLTADGPLPGTSDRSTYTYDAVGRVHTLTTGEGHVTTITYDALDRVRRITLPDGTYEEVTYTNLDATSVRDRLGRITTTEYDAVRQAIRVTDPLNRVSTLDWCACGSLRRIVDSLGRAITWEQDLMGRTIAKNYPDGSRETYSYERATSRIATVTDPRGQTRGVRYLLDDAVEGILYFPTAGVAATPSVWFEYDAAYPRLRAMRDGTGVTTYSYGPASGGMASNANRLTEIYSSFTQSLVRYSYDEVGRVSSRSIDGVAQQLLRDAAGRITNSQNALGAFVYAYENASGRVSRVDLPNGQASVRTYGSNAGDRQLQQIRNLAVGGATLSQFDYTSDALGRLTTWNQQSSGQPAVNYVLGYDAADQLVSAVAAGRDHAFGYDLAGNLRTRTLNASARTLVPNILNELQSASPALPGGDKTYSWDAENRLVGIAYAGTNQTTRLTYDGLGQCVEIAELTGTTVTSTKRFVWCDDVRCEERSASGVVQKRFFGQGEQIGGTSYYYAFDHLGSVREMTDSAGTIRARYDYDPFGVRSKVSGDLEATAGFTGHYYHAPSGLHLTRFRSYDAATGRWLSRDPLGEGEGLNLFAYAGNSPVNAVDPFGLKTFQVGGAIGGTIAAGLGLTASYGGGIIVDTQGNIGIYDALSGGISAGAGGKVGAFSAMVTGADTIFEATEGNDSTASLGGGVAAVITGDFSTGSKKNGDGYLGFGASLGLGAGLSGSLTTGPSTVRTSVNVPDELKKAAGYLKADADAAFKAAFGFNPSKPNAAPGNSMADRRIPGTAGGKGKGNGKGKGGNAKSGGGKKNCR